MESNSARLEKANRQKHGVIKGGSNVDDETSDPIKSRWNSYSIVAWFDGCNTKNKSLDRMDLPSPKH